MPSPPIGGWVNDADTKMGPRGRVHAPYLRRPQVEAIFDRPPEPREVVALAMLAVGAVSLILSRRVVRLF